MAIAAKSVRITLFKSRYNPLKITIDGVDNLSGWTAQWVFSESLSSGGATLIEKTTSDDISIDGVVVYVDIWPSDTVSIDPSNTYYHELTLFDTESNPRVAVYGDDCILRDTVTLT